MYRRRPLAQAWLALTLVVGCGPVIRTKWKVERGLARAEAAMAPNRLDYTVYRPSHRVALATSETLKAELAEFKITRVELMRDRHFDTPDGKTPEPGAVAIPPDHSACWVEGLPATGGPLLVNCRLVSFEGKTKDGEAVDIQVRLEVVGSDQRTVASVQVGGRGDATNSRILIAKISERLVNPATQAGSPEERAALKAAFDLGPEARVDVSKESDEITIGAR